MDGDGYSSDQGDCDDSNPDRYPGNTEVCDGIDNDCDGVVPSDELIDGDGDGISACQGDCNDGNSTIFPGAVEVVGDGIDQDCDGAEKCYRDLDSDTYGTFLVVDDDNLNCDDASTAYTASIYGDCNDSDPSIHPGAEEICYNIIDEDCDGQDSNGCQ